MASRELVLTRDGGDEVTVRSSGDETILDAAESADAGLPFGCDTGACGTCTARLTEGEIAYERPPLALKPRHSRAGYVLCCIARPRTDCRLEVGTAIRTELVENPWR